MYNRKDWCKNNPEYSSKTNVSQHIPSDFSISTISSFRSIENKHDVYRGKDFMKKYSEFLRKHTMKKINFKNEKNEVTNKRAARIKWKWRNLLYL